MKNALVKGKSGASKAFLVLTVSAVLLLAGVFGLNCRVGNDASAQSKAVSRPAEPAVPPRGAPLTFADLAEHVAPAVVNISTTKTINGGRAGPFHFYFNPPEGFENSPFGDFFKRFFGPQGKGGGGEERKFEQRSLGSGVIVDAREGYILTNFHVIDGADGIKVKLTGGKELEAEVKGRDKKTDLALLKVKPARGMKEAVLGDSDKLRVGDWVVAIGNPFGLENTVTAGIVSAKGRVIDQGPYDDFIQTDASINPGNSGGPLVNLAGEVIGINTAIFSRSGGNIGIGFAIPSNMANSLLPQLKTTGKVVRGYLGVLIQPVTEALAESLGLDEAQGALVAQVIKDGPSAEAGIEEGDVIVKFNGREVKTSRGLPAMVAATAVGKKVEVVVIRGGKLKTLAVKLGRLPDEEGDGEAAEPEAAKNALGLSLKKLTPALAERLGSKADKGLAVAAVEPGSPAARAGIREGDVILRVNRREVASRKEFEKALENGKKGVHLFLVERRGQNIFVAIKVKG